MHSLELPRLGDSNEYTQQFLNICFLDLSEEICRDSKQVRIIQGKRAIGVRVVEVLLHSLVPETAQVVFRLFAIVD